MTTATILRPTSDHLLVRYEEDPDTTPGGIVLPDTAKGTERGVRRAKVVSVGPGRQLESGERSEMNAAEGDVVLVHGHAGFDVQVGGEDFVILRNDAVVAVE